MFLGLKKNGCVCIYERHKKIVAFFVLRSVAIFCPSKTKNQQPKPPQKQKNKKNKWNPRASPPQPALSPLNCGPKRSGLKEFMGCIFQPSPPQTAAGWDSPTGQSHIASRIRTLDYILFSFYICPKSWTTPQSISNAQLLVGLLKNYFGGSRLTHRI